MQPFPEVMPEKGSVQIDAGPDARTEFATALHNARLRVQGAPLMDGMLHRVPLDGDRGVERSGAYKGHLDGRPAGFIQNFKTGERVTWKATGKRAIAVQDRAAGGGDGAEAARPRAAARADV